MSTVITAYGCSYCGMTSKSRNNVLRHEKNTCRRNPNRVACSNCEECNMEYQGPDPDSGIYPAFAWCNVTEDDIPDWDDWRKTRECPHFRFGKPHK